MSRARSSALPGPRRHFDLVVFGATGFTGALVAEHLHATAGVGGELSWALAGRDLAKLAAVRERIGAPPELPLIRADAGDAAGLSALVAQARCVLTTVGPYQRYGTALVEACADAGTDYVDLCGEVGWMARMIPKLQPAARRSGAHIVFSCGFDSIPFDLGVVHLQSVAQQRFGAPMPRVRSLVRVMKGTLSGGTMASALATLEAMRNDPDEAARLADPFALTPGFRGPAQPDPGGAVHDDLAGTWSGPFMMAEINTRNVHRTHFLLGHPWGKDFVYDERMATGDGADGERRARRLVQLDRWQRRLLDFGPSRAVLQRLVLPRPGQGPSARQRERGRFEVLLVGSNPEGQTVRTVVKGERDPGYGATSRIVAETARCLLAQGDRAEGGVYTPGALLGLTLVERLQARAGMRFDTE